MKNVTSYTDAKNSLSRAKFEVINLIVKVEHPKRSDQAPKITIEFIIVAHKDFPKEAFDIKVKFVRGSLKKFVAKTDSNLVESHQKQKNIHELYATLLNHAYS